MLYINPDINQTDLFRNFVSSFSQRLEGWALIRIWLQHVESYGTEKEGPMKFSRLSSNIKDVGRIEFFSKTLLKSERTLDQNRVTFPVIMPKSLMLSVQKNKCVTPILRSLNDVLVKLLSIACLTEQQFSNMIRLSFPC